MKAIDKNFEAEIEKKWVLPLKVAMARKRRCEAMTALGKKNGLQVIWGQEDGGTSVKLQCGSTTVSLPMDLAFVEAVIARVIAIHSGDER